MTSLTNMHLPAIEGQKNNHKSMSHKGLWLLSMHYSAFYLVLRILRVLASGLANSSVGTVPSGL